MFIPPTPFGAPPLNKLAGSDDLLKRWDRLIFVASCVAIGLPCLFIISVIALVVSK